jgi:VWFA-related protein
MRSRVHAGAVAALALSFFLPAPAWPQATPGPVFRAGTELVRLDVRITDQEGRPIPDLRPDDIEIEDRGRRLPVRLFQHVGRPGLLAASLAEKVGGEVSTNVGAPRGQVYVLIFDQLHITPGREQRARMAAERFVREYLQAGDRVALYGLPGPGPALSFTLDLERVGDALRAVRGRAVSGGRGGATAGGMRLYEAFQIVRGDDNTAQRVAARVVNDPAYSGLVSTGVAAADGLNATQTILREEASRVVAEADMESRTFLSLLSDVMRTLRSIEGRKAVVVFSEGFFIDNVHQDLEAVASAAADSYSVVYGVDLNALLPGPEEERPDATASLSEVSERREPLSALAIETDGRLIANATNLEQVLANIAAEASEYYLIGFEPASGEDREGAYRRVTVKVRRPGAIVKARTGYAVPAEANPATRRRTIDQALASPFPMTSLPIEYTTYVLRGAQPGAHRVVASVTVRLPAGGDAHQLADLVFVVRDAHSGRNVASGTEQLRMPDPGLVGRRDLAPVAYRVQFDLAAGEYLMRVVAREPGGLVGAADRRFRVRPLWEDRVAVSDLVLAPGDGKRIDPPTRAAARPSEGLTAYLELYPAAADPNPHVSVEVVGKDGKEIVARAAATVAQRSTGGTYVATTRLPLVGLAPGDYFVRARVTSAASSPAIAERGFHVLPADSASADPSMTFDLPAFLGAETMQRVRVNLESRGEESATLRDAVAALENGDHSRARTLLDELTLRHRDDPWPAFFLGAAEAALGRDRQAVSAWRLATALDPTLLPAHVQLADAYLRLEQPQLARQVLQAAVTANPESRELRTKLDQIEGR